MTDSNRSQTLRARFAAMPFLLAPMAGVTDAAYRIMCRRRGCATAWSEMVSVAGLAYASEKTWDLVLPAAEEPQICVQLFGSKPEQFARAAAVVRERVGERLTLIDVNMACPARKVIRKCEGSALMDAPERAEAIVRACVLEAGPVPVTVKIRKSFHDGPATAPEFAARMEAAGASAVAVHGRTASQLYTGRADWGVVDAVADRVSVPVIGSGDVFCAADAAARLAASKASAVFVARGSYGNPWVIADAAAITSGGSAPARGWDERLDALAEHLDLLRDLGLPMRKARTFAAWYLKGMPGAAGWRHRAVQCESHAEFTALVREIRESLASAPAEPAARPAAPGAEAPAHA